MHYLSFELVSMCSGKFCAWAGYSLKLLNFKPALMQLNGHKKSSFNLNLNSYRLSRGGGKKQFFWWFRREKVNQTTEEIGLVLRATGKVLQEKMKHFSCDADKEKWFTAFHHYLLRAFPLWFGALEPLSDGADRQFFSLSKDTKCFTV